MLLMDEVHEAKDPCLVGNEPCTTVYRLAGIFIVPTHSFHADDTPESPKRQQIGYHPRQTSILPVVQQTGSGNAADGTGSLCILEALFTYDHYRQRCSEIDPELYHQVLDRNDIAQVLRNADSRSRPLHRLPRAEIFGNCITAKDLDGRTPQAVFHSTTSAFTQASPRARAR